ncbi:MAG: TolC family protein [Caulobacteraceae bacterium]
MQAGLVSSTDAEQARAPASPDRRQHPAPGNRLHQRGEPGWASSPARRRAACARPWRRAGRSPRGPDGVAVGIPADTLRQRPDVRAAERSLAAASAQIGVQQAQLYPALSISGNLGTDGSRVSDHRRRGHRPGVRQPDPEDLRRRPPALPGAFGQGRRRQRLFQLQVHLCWAGWRTWRTRSSRWKAPRRAKSPWRWPWTPPTTPPCWPAASTAPASPTS